MLAFRRFQRSLSDRLLMWGAISVIAGVVLLRATAPFWRAFGQQAIGWGAIDGLIALIGRRGSNQPALAATDVATLKEMSKLRRLLWFNAGLDVLYMAGGLALLRRDDETQRGHGAGILFQGLFLFKFDLIHALLLQWMEKKERGAR